MSDYLNNDDMQPELDSVSGVEKAPKKKKGVIIAGVSAGVVAAAAGGGIIAYNCSDFVKNKVKLATSEPEEYYAWVVENTSDELSKTVSETYEKYLSRMDKGSKSVIELKYEPSDDAKSVLTDELGDDSSDETKELLDVIDGIDSISIGMDASVKDTNQSAAAYASINDEKLISLEYAANVSDMVYFARIPELSEKWIGFDAGDILKEEMDAGTSKITDIVMEYAQDPGKLLSSEDLATLVKRYVDPLASFTDEVGVEKKDEIDIGDITVDCSVITLELDEKTCYKLGRDYLKTLKGDKIIEKIVTDKLGDVTEMDSDEYKENIQELIDDFDDMIEEGDFSKETVELEIYVDNKGKICGFGMDEDEGEFFFAYGRDGKQLAVECVFKADEDEGMNFELNLETDGKKYNGEMEISIKDYDDTYEASVEISDYEVVDKEKGYFNAGIKVVIPDVDPISVDFKSDGKKQDIFYDIEIEDTDYGTVTLSLAFDESGSVDVPSADDAFMITEDSNFEDYATLDDIENFIYDLAVKLGFSDETSDMLAIYVTDEIEYEMNGSDDYYDDWDYDDYDYDYDDWDYDDYDYDYDYDYDDWDYDDYDYDYDDWDYDDYDYDYDDWDYDDYDYDDWDYNDSDYEDYNWE
ncbi:MAG: hypothetical protein PUA81_07270 [Oscillospiraceae bacterium]|nr:hypothetical protein [Oscillospiraceae bacterium]